jgi:hypothetical protein
VRADVGDDARQAAAAVGWTSEVDPTSGRVYYTNRATGESSWEPPEEAGEAGAILTADGFGAAFSSTTMRP